MKSYTLYKEDFNDDWETICKIFKLPLNTTVINFEASKLITAESFTLEAVTQ